MHLCLEGTVKKFCDLWSNSNYHYTPFYLANKISSIDNLLKINPTLNENQTKRNTNIRGKNIISFETLPHYEQELFLQKNIDTTGTLYCCNTIYDKKNCK